MKKTSAAMLGIITALALALILSSAPHALSAGTPIMGWAWSDNIGWVSLNCANTDGAGCSTYGLSTDASGNVTGYAWGDNIGIISAKPADTASCGAQANVAKGNFTGFLRALNTGSDGCISLSGSGYQATTASNPNYTNYADAAWGGDTVGWLIFNAAGAQCTPTFSCNLSGNAVNSCTGATQTCTNGCTPPTGCTPGPSYSGCISINSATCSPAQKGVLIRKGSTASIYWNVTNATSCSVTGNDGEQWTGLPSIGTKMTAALNAATIFTISCDGGAFADHATVNMVPVYKEI
jgi:hypothetical protein